MVYQVTMKHAVGKVSHDHIRNVIRRAHPEGEKIEFSYTDSGIMYSCGDTKAMVDYDIGEIVVTPGTPKMLTLSKIGSALVIPGMLIDRYVKKKHAKALAVASVACVAGLDAEPEEDSKELFEHMSEDDWTTVKHSMGIGNDFDTFQLLEDEPFDAEAESRPGNPKTGFFEIVPKEHWIPPTSWQGESDEYGIEWLNYPPHSVQFFIRDDGNDAWMMSGAHQQGAPPPVDPEIYSGLLDGVMAHV